MGFGRIFFFIFAFALLEVLVLAKVAGLIGWRRLRMGRLRAS